MQRMRMLLLQVPQIALIARVLSEFCINEQKINVKEKSNNFSTKSITNMKTISILEMIQLYLVIKD
jgi:hypothetical protein